MKTGKINYYNIIRNALTGALIMVGVTYLITVFISTSYGEFLPAPPELIKEIGMLSAAQSLAIYSAISGAVFGGSRFIWQIEKWRLVKRTIVYFVINFPLAIFASYKMHWLDLSFKGVLEYSVVFTTIFMVIWLYNYFMARRNALLLNQKLTR